MVCEKADYNFVFSLFLLSEFLKLLKLFYCWFFFVIL